MLRTLAMAVVAFALMGNATAQTAEELRASVNKGTVGIVAGSVGGTYSRFAQDLSNVIDQIGERRMVAMLGKGSLQNVYDLLFLRGIDLAIVQSDVLEALSEAPPVDDIKDKIRYITKLYNEEIHLITRNDLLSMKQLSGKRVSVGNAGSGTNMTARVVFGALDMPVEFVNQPITEAISALKSGDIEAIMYVAGKPVQLFQSITADEGLALLSIDMEKELSEAGYLDATFSNSDYPNLVSGEVPTIAVGAILSVYNWPADDNPSSRYQKTARMTNEILDSLELLKEDRFHAKWHEVDPSVMLPSWNRFEAANEWLEANK